MTIKEQLDRDLSEVKANSFCTKLRWVSRSLVPGGPIICSVEATGFEVSSEEGCLVLQVTTVINSTGSCFSTMTACVLQGNCTASIVNWSWIRQQLHSVLQNTTQIFVIRTITQHRQQLCCQRRQQDSCHHTDVFVARKLYCAYQWNLTTATVCCQEWLQLQHVCLSPHVVVLSTRELSCTHQLNLRTEQFVKEAASDPAPLLQLVYDCTATWLYTAHPQFHGFYWNMTSNHWWLVLGAQNFSKKSLMGLTGAGRTLSSCWSEKYKIKICTVLDYHILRPKVWISFKLGVTNSETFRIVYHQQWKSSGCRTLLSHWQLLWPLCHTCICTAMTEQHRRQDLPYWSPVACNNY